MRRPSFQFYPADWRNNANLQRCSPAARGTWVDVLCVLHDSDAYGLVHWPLRELANAAHAPLKLLRELADKRVLKGCDAGVCEPFVYVPRSGRREGAPVVLVPAQPGPVWYSSRMVRDEYVRTIRGEGTRYGDPPKPSPKGGIGDAPKPPKGDGPSSSSSSSATQREDERATADENPSLDGHAPTDAGMACRVMRAQGMAQTNPGDPRLRALLAQGATLAEFEGLAAEAVHKRKGFAWVLVTLAARREDAAALHLAAPHARAAAASETAWERGQRERMAQFTGGLVSAKAPENRLSSGEVFDVTVRAVD